MSTGRKNVNPDFTPATARIQIGVQNLHSDVKNKLYNTAYQTALAHSANMAVAPVFFSGSLIRDLLVLAYRERSGHPWTRLSPKAREHKLSSLTNISEMYSHRNPE